jgi:bifunctional oligoribonuclease and PAP phosphatase NrnA
MKPIHQLSAALREPGRVAITMHQKPDPDAMGSSLGLAHYLNKLGHTVQVISPTNWPDFLDWMPGCNEVIDYESERSRADGILDAADWLFCLDFNALYRTKSMESKLERISAMKVLIDHHEEPQTWVFDYGISVIPKSSTSELVYEFIRDSGHSDLIDVNIAQCLYAGVMSDTGSFRFPVTSSSVHAMVSVLMQTGFDHSKVHEHINDSFLENRLRFLGHLLSNRMEVYYEYNTALIWITKSDIQRFNIKTGDTEGIANYPLSIKGIRFAGLLIDREEERRWSFRSKGAFDCNGFARKHFEGGGHHNAAGGKSKENVEENIKKFKQKISEYQDVLTKNNHND